MRASLAIENFLEMMSAERGAAENTLESYRRDLEAVAEALSARGVNLAEAGADHIRSAIDAMATEGFAATSQARRLSALRQFFRFLYSEGYRQDDPTGTVDAPKKQKPLPKIMSVENVTNCSTAQHLKPAKKRNRPSASRRCVFTLSLKHFMPPACAFPNLSVCRSASRAPTTASYWFAARAPRNAWSRFRPRPVRRCSAFSPCGIPCLAAMTIRGFFRLFRKAATWRARFLHAN